MTRFSTPRHRWTIAKIQIFLGTLGDTGSVTDAARSAGMSRSSAQRLRRRLTGEPFDTEWTLALANYRRKFADPSFAASQELELAALMAQYGG